MQAKQTTSEQLLNEVQERLAGALYRLETALQVSEEKDERVKQVNAQVLAELNVHIAKLEAVLQKKKV